jgi:hypothetical protein
MWHDVFTKKKKNHPLHAYRIQVTSRQQAQQIANRLKQSGVRVTEEFPSHVLCHSSAELDSIMNFLRSAGVHGDDVTQDG